MGKHGTNYDEMHIVTRDEKKIEKVARARRFRWWLSAKLERIAFFFTLLSERIEQDTENLTLEDLITHIEPTDTPFLRSLDK